VGVGVGVGGGGGVGVGAGSLLALFEQAGNKNKIIARTIINNFFMGLLLSQLIIIAQY
jgi:hypothetical protein